MAFLLAGLKRRIMDRKPFLPTRIPSNKKQTLNLARPRAQQIATDRAYRLKRLLALLKLLGRDKATNIQDGVR